MNILVLNGGSSSIKCWFHRLTGGPLPCDAPTPTWTAHVERSNGRAELEIRTAREGHTSRSAWQAASLAETIPGVLESLWRGDAKVVDGPGDIDVVGHRIVHGGRAYRETALLTSDVRKAIADQCEFAPEHNRLELQGIQQVDRILGASVHQIAVFDTAFHASLDLAACVYAGPYERFDRGIRRYGFHGISHQYASRRAAEILGNPVRTVICHLGGGCSLAAVRDGRSVDTTMGFTPLDGLMMETRSGSIDPGILIYLMRHQGCSAADIDRILNRESGLKGVSGLSGDMRELLAAISAGNERARLAFDVFTHRLVREVGAMTAVLDGLDALVFTGGIGENCAPLRERVCRQLSFLGVKLDEQRNAQAKSGVNLALPESSVAVLAVHAEEEWEIARECYRLESRRATR
jgi:acetate kinase